MVAVNSTMQQLGSSAAGFRLPDVTADNSLLDLQGLHAKPLLLMFICNHCPYVIHVIKPLAEIANRAVEDGFVAVAISSNDAQAYPQDGPKAMQQLAADYEFNFPYLYDQTQDVAKAYGAACTPDFFVYDAAHKLRYRGQMDGARPGNSVPVNGQELVSALQAVKNGEPVNPNQIPSIGCNIKWRPGNAPDYF